MATKKSKSNLDTFKALLQKANVSDLLADKICESMEEYKNSVVQESKKTLDRKVTAAKRIVLEELQSYKQDLAQRVQLFCESKSQTIEQQLMRRSAADESEANIMLRKVTAILEGVELNNVPNSQVKAKFADAQKKIKRLNKKLSATSNRANRSTRIAESLLEKNKKLIKENKSLSKNETIVQESDSSDIKIPVRPQGRRKKPQGRRTAPEQIVTESARHNNPADKIAQIADSM